MRPLLFPACLLTLAVPALGQAPAAPTPAVHPHSLSLTAEAVSAGGAAHAPKGAPTLHPSNATTSTASEAIQITVRNFGPAPDNVHLEWYFIAAPAAVNPAVPLADQEYIFDQSTKDVSLAAGGASTFSAESKEAQSEVVRNKKGPPTVTGSVLHGWLVRLLADGKVIAVHGSKGLYEDLGKDEAKLNTLKQGTAPVPPKKK